MEDAAATRRCFIAVELPDAIRRSLANEQRELQARIVRTLGGAAGQAVKWVRPEGIHITLKFLGSVSVAQVTELEQALRDALEGARRRAVRIGGIGMFPSATRPRVIWVGFGGDVEALASLHQRVERAAGVLGFVPEKRPFSPHLTLARVSEELGAAARRALGSLVSAERFEADLTVSVDAISIMRSELRRGGAVYSRLAAVVLAEDASVN